MSIKTNFEMPRGDDPIKQGQRLAQDLSSNFKAIQNQIQNSKHEDLTGTFTTYVGTAFWVYNFNHSLGSVPAGFQVIDFSGCLNNTNEEFSIVRHSTAQIPVWTDSGISVKLTYTGYAGQPVITGSFKIRIFL